MARQSISDSGPQNNFAATAAPTVSNDSSGGYEVGSRWVDVTNDEIYICVDASVGAAVWEQSSVGTASEVVNVPAGTISSTDVQGALDELDSDIQGLSFAASADIQTLTASGTWTKPTGAKLVLVQLASGGGAGGAKTSSFSEGGSQGGGGGGGLIEVLLIADDITNTVEINIGTGGVTPGSSGGDTTFGSYAVSQGGLGGANYKRFDDTRPGGRGGGITPSTGFLNSFGEVGASYETAGTPGGFSENGGASGGGGNSSTGGQDGGSSKKGGAGGGGAGDYDSNDNGGDGGLHDSLVTGGGAAGGTSGSRDGADGVNLGDGGGGGYSPNDTTTSPNGGNGADGGINPTTGELIPGGGGGAAGHGSDDGAGFQGTPGKGGNGIARIITFF